MNDPRKIREALEDAETVAVVGCSPDPARPSHEVTRYLMEAGYRVIPVNPAYRKILGQPCFRSLRDIPGQIRIDIVDVFRRSESVARVAEEAIERGARFFFMQQGVVDHESAERLEAAGIGVAMDRCISVEHARNGIPRKIRNSGRSSRVSDLARLLERRAKE